MYHTKLSGNKLLLLLSLIPALFSCGKYQIISGSRVITPFEKCFSNDSLKFSFSTYAPNNLNTSKIRKADRKLLKRIKVAKNSQVLFIGFNDFNYPHYLIGLLEKQDFDSSGYQRMKSNPETLYYEDVKAKLDTVPMFYRSRKIGKNYIYEAALPFKEYTTRFLYVTDSINEDKYMSNFNEYGVDFSQGSYYSPCSPNNPFTLAAEAFKNKEAVNYLSPLHILRSHQPDYQKASEKGLLYQAFANYFSLVNEPDSVNYYWNKLGTKIPTKMLSEKNFLPASPNILKLAKVNSVVMFNEAHTNPTHRYYVGMLLDSLYALGFRYLALEALGNDSTLIKYGFPTTESGFYTNEPTMANLIRRAKKLGYQVVGYDSESSNREYEQAKNIFDRTLVHDSRAKIIVLAGHGHISETVQSGRKMMAAHFREISSINPLTIDQTTLESFTLPRHTPAGVYLLSNEGKADFSFPVQISSDIKIYNNFKLKELDNCLNSGASSIISVEVPQDSLAQKQHYVLLIHKAEELKAGIHPVPTAIKYLKNSNIATIKLCTGEYLVEVKNNLGEIVWQRKLRVN